MNTILQKRIEEMAFKESSMYDTIQEKNAAFNAEIKAATFILQNQWISVDDELPKDSTTVLAHTIVPNKEYVVVRFYPRGQATDGNGIFEKEAITHWMPIPQLKGGEK